jgi:hypothetical protein
MGLQTVSHYAERVRREKERRDKEKIKGRVSGGEKG